MTLGQFFLGMVALFVATFVYQWQKTIDRRTALLAEQRDLLGRYVASSKRLYLAQPLKGVNYTEEEQRSFERISEEEIENYSLRDQIFVSASEAVVLLVAEHDKAIREWKIALSTPAPSGDAEREIWETHGKKLDVKLRLSYDALLKGVRTEVTSHIQLEWPWKITRDRSKYLGQ